MCWSKLSPPSRAPPWLREGLVEVLAGEAQTQRPAMSAAAIDSALQHAELLETSQRAHLAAAARVRALIARYGFSAVRGWLSSGVPAGVE
jgi:stage II sporulation protein D